MILGSRLHPLGSRVRGGPQLGDVESLEQVAAAIEHADVRPVELVGGAGQEVAAPGLDVDELVGREMDGIDERQRIGLVRHGDGPGDVVDRPERIGRGPDRQELGAMLAQAAVQVIPVELAGLGDHPGLADDDAALALEGPPGVDVGVMVELGDDDRVALGRAVVPMARLTWKVSDVMFGPKAISSGEAFRKSARTCRASASAASVSALVGKAQWVLAL